MKADKNALLKEENLDFQITWLQEVDFEKNLLNIRRLPTLLS